MARALAPTQLGEQVNVATRKIKNATRADMDRIVTQFLGPIDKSQIPAGSQIISETLSDIVYVDPEGYQTTIHRDINANNPSFGQVQLSSNKPAVLPLSKQIPGVEQAIQNALTSITKGLSGELQQLTPEDEALFDTQLNNTLDQLRQQQTRQGGELITQLYGRGINKSTLANEAVANLQQAQGLVTNQALSDSVAQKLGARQFLTNLSRGIGTDIFGTITGQETQRALGAGQLSLGERQLQAEIDKVLKTLGLNTDYLNFQRDQADSSTFSKILGVGTSLLSAVPGLGPAASAGLKALLGGIAGGRGGGIGLAGFEGFPN